jgi:hypothetical protein
LVRRYAPVGESRNEESAKMEIGPVGSVRIAPMVKPRVADLGLTDVYEVERSSRTGDETYSPSGTKAASGYEDDEDSEDKYDESEDGLDEPRVRPAGNSKISRFA